MGEEKDSDQEGGDQNITVVISGTLEETGRVSLPASSSTNFGAPALPHLRPLGTSVGGKLLGMGTEGQPA